MGRGQWDGSKLGWEILIENQYHCDQTNHEFKYKFNLHGATDQKK